MICTACQATFLSNTAFSAEFLHLRAVGVDASVDSGGQRRKFIPVKVETLFLCPPCLDAYRMSEEEKDRKAKRMLVIYVPLVVVLGGLVALAFAPSGPPTAVIIAVGLVVVLASVLLGVVSDGQARSRRSDASAQRLLAETCLLRALPTKCACCDWCVSRTMWNAVFEPASRS